MNHISLNGQEEGIKQFFLSLPVDPEGSVIELDGQVVARVLPPEESTNGSTLDDEPWTDAKNARRCELIDKDIDSKLTPAEDRELKNLQRQMGQHLDRVAPLPMEGTRRLYDELLAKAEAARKG